MSKANISYETKDGVAYISLNRPPVLNTLYRKTLEELTTVLGAAAYRCPGIRFCQDHAELLT